MVTPQAEAVLAGPRLPDMLHKVTARRHFHALRVQLDGLLHLEPMVSWLILGRVLWSGLVASRRGSQRYFLKSRVLG